MTDEVAAIVRWLRERSRMAQNRENVRKNAGSSSSNDTGPAPLCSEADFARQFADEIERQFGCNAALQSILRKAVPLDGVIIVPKPAPRRRGRGRR